MSRWKIVLVTLVSLFILTLLGLCLILPGQLRSRAAAWANERSGRTLSIGAISLNPLTLTVTLRDLDLSGPGGQGRFLAFDRLKLSLSSRSLVDWALILDAVELDRPYLLLQRTGPRRFNFSDLLPPAAEPPASAAAAEPLHFSLNNLVIRDGSVDLADLTRDKPQAHTIRQLELRVPVIGNVAYLADHYVEPALSLQFDDSPLRAEGQLKPFAQSVETSLSLRLDDLDLLDFVDYAPRPLPVRVASGRLALAMTLHYQVTDAGRPQLRLSGDATLSGLNLDQPDGAPLFSLPLLVARIDFIDLAQRQVALKELSIYDPELYLDRGADGVWNFARLLPPPAAQAAESVKPAAPSGPEPVVAIETFRLRLGRVHFTDRLPPGGFHEEVREINLHLHDASNLAGDLADFSFGLQTERGLVFTSEGQAGMNPAAVQAHFQLANLPLAPYYPYLADRLTAPVAGRFGVSGAVAYDPGQSLRLSALQADLEEADAAFGGGDHLAVAGLFLDGGAIDLGRRSATLDRLRLTGAELVATRLADGRLSPQNLLRPTPPAAPAPPPAPAAQPESPWQLRVGEISGAGSSLRLTDTTLPRPGRLAIDDVAFAISELTLPKAAKSPYRLSFRIGKGKVQLAGRLVHTPLSVGGSLQLDRLPLPPFAPWLPPTVNLDVVAGRLGGKLDFQLHRQGTGMGGTIAGQLGIRRLALHDPLVHEPLLVWESLQLDGLKIGLDPLQIAVAGVALNNYQAKILVTPDARVNLASVTSAAETRPPPAAPAAVEKAGKTAAAPGPQVRIDRVTLQGGTLAFTDRHLPEVFSTTMYRLGGRITGLASDAKQPAEVDLRGELENRSPLQITGSIDPLRNPLFVALKVTFANIDLSPATPYSGTYLGYTIAKGKLFLDLDYHIEDRRVQASNRIFLDQFTFGSAVNSDQATSLPVRLAVALLKDRQGEIHLDLPVNGRTDDPKFHVWSAVFTVVKNLLVKAATAPFSLLAALVGGSSDGDLSLVAFAPGSADLSAEAQQKLARLAVALAERPALKLEISGFVDPELDPEGYRQQQLQQWLLQARRAELRGRKTNGAAAPETEVNAADYPRLLRSVYRQAKFPKPRNFLGFTKDLPNAEMEKLLLANIPVHEPELQQLAQARAAAVQAFLEQQKKELAPRLFLKSAAIEKPPGKKGEPASRVEFGIGIN